MSIHPHVSNCHLKTIKSKTDQASSSHGEEITPGRKKKPTGPPCLPVYCKAHFN